MAWKEEQHTDLDGIKTAIDNSDTSGNIVTLTTYLSEIVDIVNEIAELIDSIEITAVCADED